MTSPALGRLERVDLRDIWISEAADFTPWLARPENLAILGETLGIDLELEAQERAVGPFRADILCKDIGTDRWVLIENQLERTEVRIWFFCLVITAPVIERALGYPLEWEDLPSKRDCRTACYLNGADPEDESDWPRQHEWLAKRLNDMHRAFASRVKALDAQISAGESV
jgi:hypothetical protein